MCTASTLGTVVYGDGPEQHFSEKETRRLWRKAGGQWTKREMQCTLQVCMCCWVCRVHCHCLSRSCSSTQWAPQPRSS
jgi:hypothetical protein